MAINISNALQERMKQVLRDTPDTYRYLCMECEVEVIGHPVPPEWCQCCCSDDIVVERNVGEYNFTFD